MRRLRFGKYGLSEDPRGRPMNADGELAMRAAVLAAAAERMVGMLSGRTVEERELIDSILLKTSEVWRLVGYVPLDRPWRGDDAV